MKYQSDKNVFRMYIDHRHDRYTILRLLKKLCVSDKTLSAMVRENRFLLNDAAVSDPCTLLHENDVFTILLPDYEVDWKPAEKPADVMYEDAFVFIVHKEPGIIIHSAKDDADCLNAYAARYQLDHGIRAPVRPLHRLDKETSGLVIYSKIPFFQPWLDAQLKCKKIERKYYAVAKGSCKKGTELVIDQPIGKDRHRNGVYRISKTGKQARTDVVCIDVKGPYLLFECTLHTGRTHQIRVHLSANGYPIVNDPIYGVLDTKLSRMGLWAYEVIYTSPVSFKKHRIFDKAEFDAHFFLEKNILNTKENNHEI